MNTILITVDALRADHLGQYGYERNTMPVLDELLEGGTLFESAYANGTHTGISLPSVLTSRYLADNPAADGPTVATAVPSELTAIGVHSNTYFAARIGPPAGFDEFEDFGVGETEEEEATRSIQHRAFRRVMDTVRPTVERLGIREAAERVQRKVFPSGLIHESTAYETATRTTDRALELVDDTDGDVFLWVHYMDPHRPFCMHVDDPAFTDEGLSDDEIHQLMSKAGIKPESVTPSERSLLVDLYDSELRYTSRLWTRHRRPEKRSRTSGSSSTSPRQCAMDTMLQSRMRFWVHRCSRVMADACSPRVRSVTRFRWSQRAGTAGSTSRPATKPNCTTWKRTRQSSPTSPTNTRRL
jgi:hypothetical protein